MDPVNKWLTVVILFMVSVVIAAVWIGGSGRYALEVRESALFENHAVVYVIDTKDGTVRAKLVAEGDLQYNNRPRNGSTQVFKMPSMGRSRY